MSWIMWGQAKQGRLWHITAGDAMLCTDQLLPVQLTQGQPPLGGTVCGRCEHRVEELAAAVAAAKRAETLPT